MQSATITCPNCHASFELTAAIEQPILDGLRKKIAAQEATKAEESMAKKLRALTSEIDEKNKKLQQAERMELRLLREKRELDEQKEAFELEKARQMEAERQKIRDETRKSAIETAAIQLRELQEKLVTRDEEYRLKEAEKNHQMDAMKRQIDELRRKAEQGSQQVQGEVLELDLEAALRRCFQDDEILPVPKGTHGGDLLQRVRDDLGRECGTIIWESKRTKAWSDGWLGKLKDDKIAARADLAVLMSISMPKDIASFECRANVWITPPHLAAPLAAALRLTLTETAAAKRASTGRQDKMAAVYDYLSGADFKARVTAIFESFMAMRADLESEKRAMQKVWAKREKQLERVLTNTAGLHGDLEGIIGSSLPQITTMQLVAISDGSDNGTTDMAASVA